MTHDESEWLPQHLIDLRAWIDARHDHGIATGFIRSPFLLDDALAERIGGYFKVGATPDEGSDVVFGLIH
ncbi:hypothetical protein R69746_08402 [Paraburkholderia aspalathi]|uniref:hypothetical protein n=1 Tax=Paraburkholderia aspalathi TaxID=1324617 RepID=UPI00190B0F36|nr:hypothetical protein [Paraburkholderia aspalathi]MBK3844289.1 hypothetical protein [Paraburkholderia aspalathi]CAE6870697.1 hypothetical protein R69746_08402 [Paraburkholderia aspalathi]